MAKGKQREGVGKRLLPLAKLESIQVGDEPDGYRLSLKKKKALHSKAFFFLISLGGRYRD
jgi:hypothetical protein